MPCVVTKYEIELDKIEQDRRIVHVAFSCDRGEDFFEVERFLKREGILETRTIPGAPKEGFGLEGWLAFEDLARLFVRKPKLFDQEKALEIMYELGKEFCNEMGEKFSFTCRVPEPRGDAYSWFVDFRFDLERQTKYLEYIVRRAMR